MKNHKKIFYIILGGILFTTVSVLAYNLSSSEVFYKKINNEDMTVQGALDELYTRANTWIDPSYIDFGTLATNTAKTVLASKNGVCIKRNGTVSCFKANNWSVEQTHIQQVFSDISCDVNSSYVRCDASDFDCFVGSDGSVLCNDLSDNSGCYVDADGAVDCD